MTAPFTTSIAPWIAVPDGARALAFYTAAFGASVLHRLDEGDRTVIAQLGIDEARFWFQEEPDAKPASGPIRMILTVPDPDAAFTRALDAGATEIVAVHEAHGWRVGRLADPFGYHWEIGRPL
jgi:PhnB protein